LNLGIEKSNENGELRVRRTTKETEITVRLNGIKERELKNDTSLPFLDHMLDTLAWRACMNIGVEVKTEEKLRHPIAEDVGITVGLTFLELYRSKLPDGVEGFGFAKGAIDEAVADVTVSIEGRVNSFIDGPDFVDVEGMSGYDLIAFLEGFSQGCTCTLQVDFKGSDPHHSWEAVFRALGLALREALKPNEWRKGSIPGLKGTLE
jgi:imidazoleglycerol-phosphate dehydratase